MKNKKSRKSPASRGRKSSFVSWRRVSLPLLGAVALGTAAALSFRSLRPAGDPAPKRRPAGTVTFNNDIAPILYQHCANCHHAGGAAPFPLVSYAEAKRRTTEIADVTRRRIMPPWLPEPGCGDFVGDRSLSAGEIALLQQWAEEGSLEGTNSKAPPTPKWNDDWQLGKPDLIVTLPEPYTLDADGKDVYRNFVIPIPVSGRRYVRAVELRPGNAQAVHHAFMFIDPTRESLRLDEKDPQPGFPGLHVPATAQSPAGQFLSWQPGKLHTTDTSELSWPLERDSSLILQMHLRPTGKPEIVQPSVGFYFTDRPPARVPVKFGLWSYDIDIPAGATNHIVRDTYTLPADVDVLRILPHAHYLARQMVGTATLPDGTTKCLFRIGHWDFNWQGDYTYKQPVFLPRGSVISMEFTYDNSTNNVRNPHQPPQRVRYGVNSTDEMAELWLQVLPRRAEDITLLEKENQPRVYNAAASYNRYLIGLDPNNGKAHGELGKALLFLKQPAESFRHLQTAIRLRPDSDEPHYFLGLLYRTQRQLNEARNEFQIAVRLNPENAKAHGNLGLVLMDQGELDAAAVAFESALRLNPDDRIARESLDQIVRARRGLPPLKR